MNSRSEIFRRWCLGSFFVAWFACALYMCIVGVQWVFGVPWQPVLSIAGVILVTIFLCGFFGFLIGCFLYQLRQPRQVLKPVTWQGKLVGWVANPVSDNCGGGTASWWPTHSPEAMEFLTLLRGRPEDEILVSVNGLVSWIQSYSDEPGKWKVRWRESGLDQELSAAEYGYSADSSHASDI